MTKLSWANLPEIAARASIPQYRASDITPGIVHFGVGNFHRAHQAIYLDTLFNLGLDRDWGVIGTGVRSDDAAMQAALAPQDFLTSVVEQEADHSGVRISGALVGFIAPDDRAGIVATLSDPAIRIVAMTITVGGYYIGAGGFDPAAADIVRDAKNPDDPHTIFGLILKALKARREKGIAPFTVMSCDNVPGNGHAAQNAVVGLAKLIDAEFATWVEANVAFPNSMVDRITPATSDRERELLKKDYGIEDNWPVFCEKFTQWVMEDHFPAGRPALEKVGVQFVDDVAPYEYMKTRILNGGHASICYPAVLLDYHFVHDAMADADIRAFLDKLESEEIIPVVPPVPDTDLNEYYALIARRFSNPKIGDTVMRLAFDGSNRHPKFIFACAKDQLAAKRSVTGLSLVTAMWCRYCYGETESGKTLSPHDPRWDRLNVAAKKAKDDPSAWLAMDDILGPVARDPVYAAAFAKALRHIWQHGARATLRAYADGQL
ncbi:mannitol 2-dehydrogenase [Variibacter gotjawalensis]|uniref:Mannitol 2-dehydrogenase n=1 Tax=Variibacter gotjawalensis TaxID=1333996 RepID=A0A0S3PW83_9BRAD|nr:mannitol dehydrogenase family protein [Variibacter gotjawalensis]NIK46025.1 mannitol 2-dehydrogenase [Variibacter gotjawalensis]RZS47943.1 mannitol 2-dehydrogenase [Variibacter gotjawalensis]BAT60199.1 mannitol 2-dehydrogenase [Variibacter gotjawalensis]